MGCCNTILSTQCLLYIVSETNLSCQNEEYIEVYIQVFRPNQRAIINKDKWNTYFMGEYDLMNVQIVWYILLNKHQKRQLTKTKCLLLLFFLSGQTMKTFLPILQGISHGKKMLIYGPLEMIWVLTDQNLSYRTMRLYLQDSGLS